MPVDRKPASAWVNALRASHERLAKIVLPLDGAGLRKRSYASEWSIAQVLSHLGSAAEIFQLYLSAQVEGRRAPVQDDLVKIWDRWNAKAPESQVADSFEANESYLGMLDSLDDETIRTTRLQMFGRDLDIAGMVAMRLAEHVVHSWDVAVVLDDASRLPADAVELVLDTLPGLVTQFSAPEGVALEVKISTSRPHREYLLVADGPISLQPAAETRDLDIPHIALAAEAFIRLLYGRLDEGHTPTADVAGDLSLLRPVFRGF